MKKLFLLLSVIISLVILSVTTSLKNFEFNKKRLYSQKLSGKVLDNRGDVLFYLSTYRNDPLRLESLNKKVIDVFLEAEDRSFYDHDGVDFFALTRALYVNVKNGVISQGGSTISQQLIKIKYLSNERTIIRKLKELFLTIKLEYHCSKNEILELYLNSIYLGNKNRGIKAASSYYFGKELNYLSTRQIAFLATLIPAPSRYSKIHSKKNMYSVNLKIDALLTKLFQHGVISKDDYSQSLRDELLFRAIRKPVDFTLRDGINARLEQIIGMSHQHMDGYVVHTSIDSAMQAKLSHKLKSSPENDFDRLGAAVSMKKNGQIIAYTGLLAGNDSFFNTVEGSYRSIGPMILPFFYLAALENGYHLSTDIYRPTKNLNLKIPSDGVSIHRAFVDNLSFENSRLLYKIGVDQIRNFFTEFNFNFDDERTIFGVGIKSSPLNLVSSFNTINNDGVYSKATIINRIQDSDGLEVYIREYEPRELIKPGVSLLIADLMSRVSTEEGYCHNSDSGYDVMCVELENDITSYLWLGSLNRKLKITSEEFSHISKVHKTTLVTKKSGFSYYLLDESGSKTFVPHIF